jgi:hypothetical protein
MAGILRKAEIQGKWRQTTGEHTFQPMCKTLLLLFGTSGVNAGKYNSFQRGGLAVQLLCSGCTKF